MEESTRRVRNRGHIDGRRAPPRELPTEAHRAEDRESESAVLSSRAARPMYLEDQLSRIRTRGAELNVVRLEAVRDVKETVRCRCSALGAGPLRHQDDRHIATKLRMIGNDNVAVAVSRGAI